MIFRRPYLLPPIQFILFGVCFITTYIVSVTLDHVNAVLPYVSFSGTIAPESAIFAQTFNIGAVILYIILYIRYKLVKLRYNDHNHPRVATVARLNRISLWVILPTVIAISVAGNFSVTSSVVLHLIGGFFSFLGLVIYFLLHTVISYITYPMMNTLNMARVRLTIVIITILSSFSFALLGAISYFLYKGTTNNIYKRGPDDGGYELYVTSTACEWTAISCFGLFTLTFTKEFKNIVIQILKVEKKSETKSQQIDIGFNGVSINPLGSIDRKIDEDNNGNVGTTLDIDRKESKTLSV